MTNAFTIRVYGILMDKNRNVLVSDEWIRRKFYTKFPGGGLELGEGTRDCLKREFKEETGLDVEIGEHIYTTDYFQPSAFVPSDQIISIYYFVSSSKTDLEEKLFIPHNDSENSESFRWIPWDTINENDVTLPIDKIVVKMLKGYFF